VAIKDILYPLTKRIPGLWRSPESDALVRTAMDQDFRSLITYLEKANEPLAAYLKRSGGSDQQGISWANTKFGEYYATTTHVYRAVKLRADAVASARLKAWVLNNRGERVWVGENHVVQKLLDHVNPFWSRVDMWRAVETYLSLWGSCFRWINKPTSDPSSWEIWVLRPDRVAIVVDKSSPGPQNQYIKGFIYDPGGAKFPMLREDVVWDRYFNPLDEFSGLSPIAPTRLVIDMQASMLSTNRDLFRNGLLTSNLAFLMKGPLSPIQVETFYERLAERHAGPGNSNKPIVSDMGQGDVKNMGFSNKEMEFLEGLQLSKEYILATYGVPEELIPGARHATFSNREEARKEFYESTVEQEWVLLESGQQEKFVPQLPGRLRNVLLAFDRDEVPALQENIDRRSERHLKEVASGTRTLNEYRESTGMAPIPQGNVLYIPVGVQVVTLTGNELVPPTPIPTASFVPAVPTISGQIIRVLGKGKSSSTDITDLDREVWGSFIKRFDKSTEDFHELMNSLFQEQREDTLLNLTPSRDGPGGIFEPIEWWERFIEAGTPLITASLERSAEAQIEEFGLTPKANLDTRDFHLSAEAQAWIDERAKFWTERVNAETAKLITEEIQVGISEGESIKKLQDRVNKVFNFSEEFRSERVARTEASASSNHGNLEAYRQADIPRKRWLASIDDRTRGTHSDAHGQTVERDQSFLVGGHEMIMPGDGPASEVVNCRCTTTPVFSIEEE